MTRTRHLIDMIRESRELIIEQIRRDGKTNGKIDCLICKHGKIRYQLGMDGCLRAQCSTSGCSKWFEVKNEWKKSDSTIDRNKTKNGTIPE